jgi:hypothetical protein
VIKRWQGKAPATEDERKAFEIALTFDPLYDSIVAWGRAAKGLDPITGAPAAWGRKG